MGEVEPNHYSPSAVRRPSPSSVADILGIVQLQQLPSSLAPPSNGKGFNNPLPAIGKSSHEPQIRVSHSDPGNPRYLSKSFPSPRSLTKDLLNENGSPRSEDILPKARGGKIHSKGLLPHQGRKDINLLPPLSNSFSSSDSNVDAPISPLTKTALARTFSDGESTQRPRSNSNPRPQSARGQRTRSFHGEASHQMIRSEMMSNNRSNTNRLKGQDTNDKSGHLHVLLTQRRSHDQSHDLSTSSSRETDMRTSGNHSPVFDDTENGLERPSAPSPPSPGLDSDCESDVDLHAHMPNLNL